MILYKPTGQIFENRKDAKLFFGASRYYKIEKEKTDILFINNIQLATNEIFSNNETDMQLQK